MLAAFVEAARAGEIARMRSLLSEETRATVPVEASRSLAGSLVQLESPRVVFSRVLGGGRWGVAAVAGDRVVDGEREPFSYGAALVRERGAWRIELAALVLDALEPEPLEEAEPDAAIGARVSAAEPLVAFVAWVDGRRVRFAQYERTTFTTRARGRAPRRLAAGQRDAVVFAATATAAAAVAWPFVVES